MTHLRACLRVLHHCLRARHRHVVHAIDSEALPSDLLGLVRAQVTICVPSVQIRSLAKIVVQRLVDGIDFNHLVSVIDADS